LHSLVERVVWVGTGFQKPATQASEKTSPEKTLSSDQVPIPIYVIAFPVDATSSCLETRERKQVKTQKQRKERRDFIKTTDHAAEALMQPPIRRLRRSTSSFITRRQSLSSTKASQLFVGRLVAVMQRKERIDLATELLSMPLKVSRVYLCMRFRVFVFMHVFLIYLFVCTHFVIQNFAWCSYVIRVHVPE
jgi:hypothetical protein